MISIENANLEGALAILFSRTVSVPFKVGQAIYLTPKSAIARIEIFKNAARAMLSPNTWKGDEAQQKQMAIALSKIIKLIERAETLTGKRHGIIHDRWFLDSDTDEVARLSLSLPAKTDGPVPLATLERLIADFRSLIDDVHELSAEFKTRNPHMVNLHLR